MQSFPDFETNPAWTEPGIWERGEEMFRKNAVVRLLRVGTRVYARVQGERLYEVGLDIASAPGIARCTCPMKGKPWCKHLVAVGLALESGKPDTPGWEQDPTDGTVEVARAAIWLSENPFSPESIQIKIDEAADAYQWLDALAWWLAWEEAARMAHADWPQLQLPEWPDALVVPLQKALVALLFDRFQAMESYWEGRPSRAHLRYDWEQIRPVVQSLSTEFVSRHFAEMRALALGLSL